MKTSQHLLNADEPILKWDLPITPNCGEPVLSPHPTDMSDYNTGALTNESLEHNFPRLCRVCIERPRPFAYLYLIETGEGQAARRMEGEE